MATTRADHLRVLTALALAAALATSMLKLVAVTKHAEAAFPGKNGKITFVRGTNNDSEDREIYVMDQDGSGQTRLTDNTMVDSLPAFSPDGERIAFTSRRDVNDEIYVMDAVDSNSDGDGDNLTRLTNTPVNEFQPAFSSDGRRIAFTSNQAGNNEVYLMDTDPNTNDTPIRLTTNAARDARPAFSPNGQRVAFTSNRDGDDEIYVMDATDLDGDGNGDNLAKLTDNTAVIDTFANFSPDGGQVAFTSRRDGNFEIYVIKAAPEGPDNQALKITDNSQADEFPAFSPDGKQLVFSSNREGNFEIYVIKAAPEGPDNQPRNLTHNPMADSKPDWGPFFYDFRADLEVRFRHGPPSPKVGDKVKIVLTVTNNGPDAAQNVSIEGELTNRERRVRNRSMIQECSTGGTVEECLAELPPGKTIKTTFSGTPLEPQRIKASYQASSDATDPDPNNNEDSVNFRVTRER
jgi:dipeptidyl aminopeptidase/acylaminoacyl peptidase